MSTPIGMVDQQYDSTGTQELPKNFGSLPVAVASNSEMRSYTVVSSSGTYVFTTSFNSNGDVVNYSGWVKQ